eukprot:5860448-Amphidinium_carterae.1
MIAKYAGQYATRTRQSPADPESYSRRREKECRTPNAAEVKDAQAKLGAFIAATSLQRDFDEASVRIRHLLQYVATAPSLALVYHPEKVDRTHPYLTCYVDASFSPTGGFSRSGFLIQIGGLPVVWQSNVQKVHAESSTEAELLAAVFALRHVRLVRNVMGELMGNMPPAKFHIDCELALVHLFISGNVSWRSKYLQLRANILAETVKRQELTGEYVNTKAQVADIFAKGCSACVLQTLLPKVPMMPLERLSFRQLQQ